MTCFTRIFLTGVAIGSTVFAVLPAHAESSSTAQAESTSSQVSEASGTPVARENSATSASTIVVSEASSQETVAANPPISNPRVPIFSRIFPAPSMQQ